MVRIGGNEWGEFECMMGVGYNNLYPETVSSQPKA